MVVDLKPYVFESIHVTLFDIYEAIIHIESTTIILDCPAELILTDGRNYLVIFLFGKVSQ